jgi:nucleotide-binding universal stress UspA family protein
VAKAAKEAGVSCKTFQVENGQPHQAVIAAAEDKGCDLIVMSSHGRSGIATNNGLTHAKTPVLVCP